MYEATWLVKPASTILARNVGSKDKLNKKANTILMNSVSPLAKYAFSLNNSGPLTQKLSDLLHNPQLVHCFFVFGINAQFP